MNPAQSQVTARPLIQLRLTKAELAEFELSSSFDTEEIELLRQAFERMQCAPEVTGKVSLKEFCLSQGLKEDQLLSRKLFEKLDLSRDGYLNFFDLLQTLDGANQKEFKSRLKFYFEWFCEADKKIIASKMLKMQREIGDMFPGVVLPADYWLGKPNSAYAAEQARGQEPFGSRRGSVDDQKDEEASLKLFGGDRDNREDAEEIGLDEFYDHIDKVYGALS